MNALSMFSNVGVAEIFLKKLGIGTVVANEIEPKRVKFYEEIYKDVDVILGDIKKINIFEEVITKSIEKKVDFILATPPCQGMSTAGKGKRKKNWRDERNVLIKYVIKAVKEIKPKYVFIENVPTFNRTIITINGQEVHIEDYIRKELSEFYYISNEIFNAADLGVAQNRKRSVFLLSNLTKCDENHFLKIENVKKAKKQKTVKDAIGDLPSLEPIIREDLTNNIKLNFEDSWHTSPIHAKRHVDIMKKTPTGKSAFENPDEYKPKKQDGTLITGFLSTYKRMEWDKPSPTVTMTNGSISSQNNVHPGKEMKNGDYSDPRVLTILEIMRIMSIPDTWPIPGWAADNFIRSVIGEGIPPLMIFTILKQIKEMEE